MDIRYFHKYNKLVRRSMTKPLTHHCGMEYALRATEDGEPVLQCFNCDTLVQPGLALYDQVRGVVREHE